MVLSRLGGGEVREEGHVVKRKEGYMCKGREKKGTGGEYRLKCKSLEYTTKSRSSTRGQHRVFGSTSNRQYTFFKLQE